MDLSVHSVLITGTSQGIGLELVRQMLELPNPPNVLIACCRDPRSAVELQSLSAQSRNLHIVKMDVTDDDDIQRAYEITESLVGDHGLTLLINNAGIFENKPDGGHIRIMTRQRMNRHYEINVTSPTMISQKFLPLLKRAADYRQSNEPSHNSLSVNKAAVVMVGSLMGSQTKALDNPDKSKENIDYRCSKTALHMAVILMSRDLKKDGILVMAIHPGWVRTKLGGNNATLTIKYSVEECLKVLSQANESNHGHLTDYTGIILPF